MSKPWRRYSTGHFFDELITDGGSPRVAARRAVNFFKGLSAGELQARRAAAELAMKAAAARAEETNAADEAAQPTAESTVQQNESTEPTQTKEKEKV